MDYQSQLLKLEQKVITLKAQLKVQLIVKLVKLVLQQLKFKLKWLGLNLKL